MKISTKGRYAVRMLLDIAMHQKNEMISLRDIAERQQISKKYLEQIAAQLTQAGILTASRGQSGGRDGQPSSAASALASVFTDMRYTAGHSADSLFIRSLPMRPQPTTSMRISHSAACALRISSLTAPSAVMAAFLTVKLGHFM